MIRRRKRLVENTVTNSFAVCRYFFRVVPYCPRISYTTQNDHSVLTNPTTTIFGAGMNGCGSPKGVLIRTSSTRKCSLENCIEETTRLQTFLWPLLLHNTPSHKVRCHYLTPLLPLLTSF